MNIYLISQDVNDDWDSYDSAVVVEETEEEARMIHPDGRNNWDGIDEIWGSWANKEYITVKLIGKLTDSSLGPIICASFKAG